MSLSHRIWRLKEGQVVNRLKDKYLKEKRKQQTAEDILNDFEKPSARNR